MPQLAVTPDTVAKLTPVMTAEPVLTLKLAGLLHGNLDNVSAILVDDVDNPTAVLVRSGAFWSFFGVDVDAAISLLDELPWGEPLAFAGIWEPLVELLAERAEVRWQNPCFQYHILQTDELLDQAFELGGDVEDIHEASDAVIDRILEHWPYGDPSVPADREHVTSRIDAGITAAWYDQRQLVAWALAAPDTSIGYLHTMDQYRNQGIGLALTANLVLRIWNVGLTPFCYVVHDNQSPNSILRRLGFQRAPDRFVWLGTAPR